MRFAPAVDRMANIRDVGGLVVEGGGAVRSGVLYRSDQPLPGDRVPDLDPWPPSAIIDLRSPHELRAPHPLTGVTPKIVSVAVMDEAEPARIGLGPGQPDLARRHGRLYARMLELSGRNFATIAATVAEASGPTLVHCAAGKDRTGVTIAVLLSAVGVLPREIVADYQVTAANAPALFERLVIAEPEASRRQRRERLLAMHGVLSTTPHEAIEGVISELADHPSGAGGWLVDNGLSRTQLELLRERLVDPEGALVVPAAPVVERVGAIPGAAHVGGQGGRDRGSDRSDPVRHDTAVLHLPARVDPLEVVNVTAEPRAQLAVGGEVEDKERLAPRLVAVDFEDRLAEQVVQQRVAVPAGRGSADIRGELTAGALEGAVVVIGLLGVARRDALLITPVDSAGEHRDQIG
jgi:protein-tyrosine phosphatase